MKITIRNTVAIPLCLLLAVWLTACRASKRDRFNMTQAENASLDKNSHSVAESNLQTEIKAVIEGVLSESLNFEKQEIQYDTDKPVLPETGKPPVKKETEIKLSQKKEDKKHLNETQLVIRQNNVESADHVVVNTSVNRSIDATREKNIQKESDIFLKWVGGITICLVVLVLILYILGRYLKKRLHNFL